MCGFAGWLRTDGVQAPEQRHETLRRMGAQLARRGPDDATYYDDGLLALTFRRLAVNDPCGGRQPLVDESGTVTAVVNGEIYNHQDLRTELAPGHTLASDSDCEVVVHLYEEHGPDLLTRLNGMYALCVWDRRHRQGLLARDRLGIKPLYYTRLARGGVLFASELKALLAHPECPREPADSDVDLSWIGTEDYTSPNAFHVPTFVRGVHLLGGGESLVLEERVAHLPRRYWSLEPSFERSRTDRRRSVAHYAEAYADLLADSFDLQLTAGAEVGAFLSGGLDSSALVAAAADRGLGPHCFSVSEPTTVATGDVGRARDLTAVLGVPFHPVRYDPARLPAELDFGLASLEELVWAMDAPRFAPESFFKFELHRYAKTVRPDLKVMLIGQGADEFAGGYSSSFSSPRPDWAAYEAEALGDSPGSESPFHAEMRRRLIVLQSHNLWNEDRVAAAFGVEARVPYLDHRLIELLASIPAELHPELFFDKAIVRRAASRWLGPRWCRAPKVLFWQATDRSSVHAVMAACARRVLPQFREQYADDLTPRAWSKLDRCRAEAGSDALARAATQRLLAVMTTSIFARLCRDQADPTRPIPVAEASRLQLDVTHLVPAAAGAP